MANIKDCPGFETFGADVKAARNTKHLSRRALAEIIDIDSRYLANIENEERIRFPLCRLSYSLSKYVDFPWNGTSIQRLCGRKAHRYSVSATN